MTHGLRAPVSRLGALSNRLWRLATADLRAVPDFLILGAQKGGTSSLFAYLRQHPQVIGASRKEVDFFTVHHGRGGRWYRSHFPLRFRMSRRATRLGRRVVTGEATPYYLFHPCAAERIYRLVPAARLIILLRDPVARAYSHYNKQARSNQAPPSFAEALTRESALLDRETQAILADPTHDSIEHRLHSYLARGCYLDQLKAYERLFGGANILVLRSEDLFADPQHVYDLVLAFLGLEPCKLVDAAPATPSIYADRSIPGEAALRERFRPHNDRLYAHIGRDMAW